MNIEALQKLSVIIDGEDVDCDELEFIFDEAYAPPISYKTDAIVFGDNWSYTSDIRWETPTYFSHCTDSEPTVVYD